MHCFQAPIAFVSAAMVPWLRDTRRVVGSNSKSCSIGRGHPEPACPVVLDETWAGVPSIEGNLPSLIMPLQMAAPTGLAQDDRLFLWLRMATVVAVAFTFGNALWAAWDQGVTYDEFYHLEWPRRLLYERIDERDSALRFDSKTPVLLPAVVTVRGLAGLGLDSRQVRRFAARLTPVLYLAFCLGLVALLAGFSDPAASWVAVLLIALDPNMAAHASIATSDVGYAVAVLLLVWAMMRSSESWTSALLIGAVVGLAFAVKYTAVLLVPIALFHVAWRAPRSPRAIAVWMIALAGASCLSMSILYLLVGVGVPLGSVPFQTSTFQRLAQALPSLPLPFPSSVLTGIDRSMDHNDHLGWNGYLFGQIHQGGVWYYFVAHWLMKTPVALVFAVTAGLWQMRNAWREKLVGISAALFGIHLAYFSFFFSTQLGIRYALLCIPLASLIAGSGLARLGPRRAWWLLPLAALALAERLPYWGDPIAFTNLSVWPKSRAYWYTADSNLDYGQNRERLPRYVQQRQVSAIIDQATVTPGLYVVSANNLTKFGNFRSHRWLIDHDIPATNFGFTDFGFSITGERFEAYMNDTRMAPSRPDFEDLCAGSLPHYAPGSRLPFIRTDHPDEGRLWVVCVRSTKGVDVGFTVEGGRLLFGKVDGKSSCTTDLLQAGQAAWLRVPRGGNAQLCLREIPFRRPSLPYLLTGYLTVRGQGADVEIRQVPTGRLVTQYGQESAP